MSDVVTVLLVDDHAVVREGYRRLLERSKSIRVVGEAGDAQSAYLAYLEHHPQVTVMDIALPGASGIEALRRIRARDAEARVLMFSMYEDPVFAARALQAGARGYVTKAAAPDVLVEAVLAVARGEPYLASRVAQELALRKMSRMNRMPRRSLAARVRGAAHAGGRSRAAPTSPDEPGPHRQDRGQPPVHPAAEAGRGVRPSSCCRPRRAWASDRRGHHEEEREGNAELARRAFPRAGRDRR